LSEGFETGFGRESCGTRRSTEKRRESRMNTLHCQSAEPLLASSLLTSHDLDAILSTITSDPQTTAKSTESTVHALKTGIEILDSTLTPLLQPGRVTALSSTSPQPRTELATSLLVDCLVSDAENLVAVVDTVGNFDVVGLYGGILKRMGEGKEEMARGMLDRVRIMRVFDFVGVGEAVGELREGVEGGKGEEVQGREEGGEKMLQKRTEVADSEDEGDEEEMLFDMTGPPLETTEPHTASPSQPTSIDKPPQTPKLKLKLILLDNLSHVLTPLLKKDSVSATTLATTFLRTLTHLTYTHGLYTILLNPCTTPPPTHQTQQQPQQQPTPQQQHPPSPSLFASQIAVPALLGLLSRYTDAHVFISDVPRGRMDARVFYADVGGRERGKRRGVEMVRVVEVIGDRWGDRVGDWCVF
jgi:hypothetical protein